MIVDTDTAKDHLNVTSSADDAVIGRLIEAAQNQIENQLGFKIEDQFGGEDQDPIPASLKHAVLMMVAHYFENREAVLVGVNAQALPMGVGEIVREYREWF